MHFVFQVAMYIMIKVSLNEAIDELAPFHNQRRYFLMRVQNLPYHCFMSVRISNNKNFRKAFNIYSKMKMNQRYPSKYMCPSLK